MLRSSSKLGSVLFVMILAYSGPISVKGQIVIGTNSSTPSNITINTYYFANTVSVYPPIYFTGQIITINASCSNSSNCTAQTTNQMVQEVNFTTSVINTQAFSTNSDNQTIIQNSTGVFQYDGSTLTNITNFTAITGISTCPLIFTDVMTKQIISVCNVENSATALFVNTTNSTFSSQINLDMTNFTAGYYLNGFVVLTSTTQVQIYAADYSFNPSWQLISSEFIPTRIVVSPISVSIGQNVSSLQNPVIGLSLANQNNVTIQTIVFNVPFVESASALSDLGQITINSNSSRTNISWQDLVPVSLFPANTQIVQVLQIDQSQQINSTCIQVPTIFITSQIHLRFNLSFINSIFNEAIFMCPYSQYGNFTTLLGASALNDILVVPYQGLNNVTYGVYQSSNPMFGGNGVQVCNGVYNANTTQTVPIIGGLDLQQNISEQTIALTQVLSNGQIGTTQQTNQSQILQLSPFATIFVELSVNFTNLTETQQLIVQASNYISSDTVALPINFNVQTSTPFNRPPISGLEIGLIVAGFVFLMGTLAFLFHKSQQNARQDRENLIEI